MAMEEIILYQEGEHTNYLLEDVTMGGLAIQANHHLIVNNGEGILLDPGGHKSFSRLQSDLARYASSDGLRYLFCSHQDPDIVAAINGWLMVTEADAYLAKIWTHFVAHFGIDSLFEDRMKEIPDEGMYLPLGSTELMVLPAHFLHACGMFQVYDPVSKILYSGDLGTSLGIEYRIVTDFDAHIPQMESFHRRFMGSNIAMRAWANMVRGLDIEIIAPQHGAAFKGKPMVNRFIEWCEQLSCGIDVLASSFKIPTK